MTASSSWLSVFDSDDRASFFAEMREALETSAAKGNPEALEACLREWKVTAEAMGNPVIRAALTSVPADEDFAGAARPGVPDN